MYHRKLACFVGLVAAAGCTGHLTDVGEGAAAGSGRRDDRDPANPGIGATSGCEACEETIPAVFPIRRLTRNEVSRSLEYLFPFMEIAEDALPADTIAQGFAYGDVVPPVFVDRSFELARDVAEQALPHVRELAACGDLDDRACARSFITRFGRKVVRRTLDDEHVADLEDVYQAVSGEDGFEAGISAVIEALIVSPDFLYFFEPVPGDARAGDVVKLDGWSMASRLSFAIAGLPPDDALLDAAERGELDDATGLQKHAERLLQSPARDLAGNDFFSEWLELDDLDQVTARASEHFGDATSQALRTSFLRFTKWARQEGTLGALYEGRVGFVNDQLAPMFGVEENIGSDMVQVDLGDDPRSVVTHPAIMTLHAKAEYSDPIARGVFIRETLLCLPQPPPPGDADTAPPLVDPNATTRERFAQKTSGEACVGCHQLINPAGFALEQYDQVGIFRTEENGLPIDSSGALVAAGDATGEFADAHELSESIAQSEIARSCMVSAWYRYATGRPVDSNDEPVIEWITQSLDASSTEDDLMLHIVGSDPFRFRTIEDGVEP